MVVKGGVGLQARGEVWYRLNLQFVVPCRWAMLEMVLVCRISTLGIGILTALWPMAQQGVV